MYPDISSPHAVAQAPEDTRGQSIADTGLNRDGLKAGTAAPVFTLPRSDGGTLSLDEYRQRRVLLVFSDPECGPCDELAPHLERIHRASSNLDVIMVSRDAERTRAKIGEHGLTFPVVLQRRWEVSRDYGMFAMPIGYLINEEGIIAAPVAVGGVAILALPAENEPHVRDQVRARLASLQAEFEKGQADFDSVERHRAFLRDTLLRIDGAMQVLRELDASLADRPVEYRTPASGRVSDSDGHGLNEDRSVAPEEDRNAVGTDR